MVAPAPEVLPFAVPEAHPKRHAAGLVALSVVAVVLAPFAVSSCGAGAACAVVVLLMARRLRNGGRFYLRGPVIIASIAVVLSVVSTGACSLLLLLRPAEVRGAASQQQERVEDGFDRAFEAAKAPPPPRDAGLGDDDKPALAAAVRDAGPDPRHDAGSWEQP